MGLLGRIGEFLIKSEGAKKESIAVDKTAPFAWSLQRELGRGLKKPSNISFDTLRRMSFSHNITRICINTLKHTVTKTKWDIVSKDPKVEADPSKIKELKTLLMNPNNTNVTSTFRKLLDATLEDLLALDAGVWEKVRNGKGEIAEIYTLDGATIRPSYDEYGVFGDPAYVQYVRSKDGGVTPATEYPAEDIVYMMQNPQTNVRMYGYGVSPVETMIMVATNSLMADDYNSRFFTDDSVPGILIDLGETATTEQIAQFREFWRAEVKGKKYAAPIIGGTKNSKVMQYKPTHTDMQFMEYQQWLAKLTIAAFEMSPQDVGLAMDMYKAEGKVQQELSKNQGIRTLLNTLKEEINTGIVNDPGWNGRFDDVEFDWMDVDKTDAEMQAAIDEKEVKSGITTVNEARKARGKDPIENGDRLFVVGGQVQYLDGKDAGGNDIIPIDPNKMLNQKDKSADKKDEKLKKSYTDQDKLQHAPGGEVSYDAYGEGLTRDEQRLVGKVFELAATMAYGGKQADYIQMALSLVPMGSKRNLRECVEEITRNVQETPNCAYAAITHFEKTVSNNFVPFYEVYKYDYDNTLLKTHNELPGLKKKATKKAVVVAEGDWEKIYTDLTKSIQTELRKLYPKLVGMINVKKEFKDNGEDYEDWDLKESNLTPKFNYELWVAAFTLGATKIAQYLSKKKIKHATVIELTKINNGFLKERARLSARSAGNTIYSDAIKFIKDNQHLSYKEMAQGLKDLLGYEDEWRAKRIAVTETRYAMNQGRLKMGASVGVEFYKVYPGPRPCPICISETNNYQKIYRYDDAGKFPLHPNCQCSVEIVLPEEIDLDQVE